MKMLNPNAAEWTPTAFGAATVIGTKSSSYLSCAASSKNAAAAGQLAIPTGTQMQQDSDSGLTTPNGLAELASVLSGATSADMTFEDLMFDNSSRRGSVSSPVSDMLLPPMQQYPANACRAHASTHVHHMGLQHSQHSSTAQGWLALSSHAAPCFLQQLEAKEPWSIFL